MVIQIRMCKCAGFTFCFLRRMDHSARYITGFIDRTIYKDLILRCICYVVPLQHNAGWCLRIFILVHDIGLIFLSIGLLLRCQQSVSIMYIPALIPAQVLDRQLVALYLGHGVGLGVLHRQLDTRPWRYRQLNLAGRHLCGMGSTIHGIAQRIGRMVQGGTHMLAQAHQAQFCRGQAGSHTVGLLLVLMPHLPVDFRRVQLCVAIEPRTKIAAQRMAGQHRQQLFILGRLVKKIGPRSTNRLEKCRLP